MTRTPANLSPTGRNRADRCAVCGDWDSGCTSTFGSRATGERGVCATWAATGWAVIGEISSATDINDARS